MTLHRSAPFITETDAPTVISVNIRVEPMDFILLIISQST